MEITIKLHGNLRRFGNEFKLKNVSDSAEALRAMYAQIAGFRLAIQRGYFKIVRSQKHFTMDSLKEDLYTPIENNDVLHITPVITGSGGAVQTIVGAVLIVVGAFTSWTGVGTALMGMGAALMASGVAQMLAKTPSADNPNRNETEKKQSTSFSNLQNLVAQGRPVPLAYGRILVGSLIIGKGVETLNIQLYKPNPQVTYTTGFRGLSTFKA